jgi:N-methylhydantoinase B
MTVARVALDVDPIMVEVFRTRVEAIAQEAGAAIENTAISPIVTETKDYSVTILDGVGTFIRGAAAVPGHFGAGMHAVTATLKRHRDSIVDGDVFIANDPHSDGGLHPQDVVVQRPVFFEGDLVAWVAITAHMLDMGGMVPGSSATKATECYQEALRFPSVRLFRAGVEAEDMWEVLRTNLRSFDMIEMDLRSLVVGTYVAKEKLLRLFSEIGPHSFRNWARMLDATTGEEYRRRLATLEPGSYSSTAWVEVDDGLEKVPVKLNIRPGGFLEFDLRDAPPQIPRYVNSKPYILRLWIAPALLGLLAPDLPLTQSVFDAFDLQTTPGSIVDCRPPAPIGAAQTECALAVHAAAIQCVALALPASPNATMPLTAPLYDAIGTTRWSFRDQAGQRTVFTFLDAIAGGSQAGLDRDGLDLVRDIAGRRNSVQLADTEVLESVYPILFRTRGVGVRRSGAGRYRAGAGLRTVFEPRVDAFEGNMTGSRGWFPCTGMAGGLPGACTSFRILRANRDAENLTMHATAAVLNKGDGFELGVASGGGFGDPLDRDPLAVAEDHAWGRLDFADMRDLYGVILTSDGRVDEGATELQRASILSDRLGRATPPAVNLNSHDGRSSGDYDEARVLFPGVIQRAGQAVSERSGAILAVAPAHWTDGCHILENPYPGPGRIPLVLRSYLDPITGHALHTELVPRGDGRSFETMPDCWTKAAATPPRLL